MDITKIITIVLAVFGLVFKLDEYTHTARRNRQIETLTAHAAVPGLDEAGQQQLLGEAHDLIWWGHALRKYPMKWSMTGPLIALLIVGPAALILGYPTRDWPDPNLVMSASLPLFALIGLWMLAVAIRDSAEWTRWKLCQLTQGADIAEVAHRPIGPELRRAFANTFRSSRNQKELPMPHIAILYEAIMQQRKAGSPNEPLPELPPLDDRRAWEDRGRSIDPEFINAAIAANNWQRLEVAESPTPNQHPPVEAQPAQGRA